MARAFRFDSISVNADGSVAVGYTYGTSPLPSQASGKGLLFPNRKEVVESKNAAINNFTDSDMFDLAIAIYSLWANDPNLTQATALVGHTMTLDPTKPAAALKFV